MKGAQVKRLMACVAVTLCAAAVLAQSGGGFDILLSSVGGPAGIMNGGAYLVAGDSNREAGGVLSGGSYQVQPGFMQDSSFFPLPVTVSVFELE